MKLNYRQYGSGEPVIILHGLLGSLDNWQAIARVLSTHYQIIVPDQRNHGRSPHSPNFSYELLAEDILELMEDLNLENASVIGHSMGGKVAMKLALNHSEKISKAVFADIAPAQYEDRHQTVFKALLTVNLELLESRQQAEGILFSIIGEDQTTIQFLMKGLYRDEANQFKWRFNVRALYDAYFKISAGICSNMPFTRPVLFIKGEMSDYINPANYTEINSLFPNNRLLEIAGAGHWVHADKPAEFTDAVLAFLG